MITCLVQDFQNKLLFLYFGVFITKTEKQTGSISSRLSVHTILLIESLSYSSPEIGNSRSQSSKQAGHCWLSPEPSEESSG